MVSSPNHNLTILFLKTNASKQFLGDASILTDLVEALTLAMEESESQIEQISISTDPSEYANRIRPIIEKCLQIMPSRRPTASELFDEFGFLLRTDKIEQKNYASALEIFAEHDELEESIENIMGIYSIHSFFGAKFYDRSYNRSKN